MAAEWKYTDVEETNGIRGNGRKKLLIVGKTGTGKSSLCNVVTGNKHNATIYIRFQPNQSPALRKQSMLMYCLMGTSPCQFL